MPKRLADGSVQWRMESPCADCPFHEKGPGRELRRSLGQRKWRGVLAALRREDFFVCHKTTMQTGDGSRLVCAGSIAWQEEQGVISKYRRVWDTLAKSRAKRIKTLTDTEP